MKIITVLYKRVYIYLYIIILVDISVHVVIHFNTSESYEPELVCKYRRCGS